MAGNSTGRKSGWTVGGAEVHWRRLRWPDAEAQGYSRDTFDDGTEFARSTAQDFAGSGTPRQEWRLPETSVRRLTKKYVDSAAEILETQLATRADPALEGTQVALEEAAELIGSMERGPLATRLGEFRETYDLQGAWEKYVRHSQVIAKDEAAGGKRHRRWGVWFRALGHVTPFLEVGGLLAMMAFYLNVDFMRPQEDIFSWTLVMVLVIMAPAIQYLGARSAGEAQNRYRDADSITVELGAAEDFDTDKAGDISEEEKEEAQARNFKRPIEANVFARNRNIWLGVTLAVALVITTLMTVRLLDTSEGAATGTVLALLGGVVVAGFGMPSITFVAKAFDGSAISREKDDLISWLEETGEQRKVEDAEGDALLAGVVADHRDLRETVFPEICQETQDEIDGAIDAAEFAYYQLGIREVERPKPKKVFRESNAKQGDPFTDEFTTGLNGGMTLETRPLKVRWGRMESQEVIYMDLEYRLRHVPAHPLDGGVKPGAGSRSNDAPRKE